MKALAIIFLLIGLLALFIAADLHWGFIPLGLKGPEEGLIVGSIAFVIGIVSSLFAAVFAFVAWRRRGTTRSPGFLLCCAGALLLGFVLVFIL
jgi:hypothetical protein